MDMTISSGICGLRGLAETMFDRGARRYLNPIVSMSERQALGDATSRLANAQIPVVDLSGGNEENSTSISASKPAAGTKRKAQDPAPQLDPEDFDLTGQPIDKSCNQIRGMIRRFLESGQMKKGEFSNAIGVSTKSLSSFLAQNGPMKGAESLSYGNAWEFFKKRELAGVKAPKKPKASVASGSSAAQIPDISSISLPGEENNNVQVYETCDEVRKKINAHLVKPGVTQASFCRELTAQLHTGTKIQSKQLADFRSKKGPRMGNTSSVFYAAYVYFEKIRLAEKKPKSKHREEMEKVWTAEGGFDRVHGGHQG